MCRLIKQLIPVKLFQFVRESVWEGREKERQKDEAELSCSLLRQACWVQSGWRGRGVRELMPVHCCILGSSLCLPPSLPLLSLCLPPSLSPFLLSLSLSLYEYVCIYLTKDLQEVPSDIDLTRYWQVNTEGQSKRGQPLQFSIVQSQRKLIPIVGCSYAKGRMLWCVSSGISTGSLTWISDAQVINLSVTRRGSDGNSVVLFMTCVKKRPDAQNIPGTWNRSKQKFLHRIQKSFVPWVSAVEEQGYRSLWSGKSMCNVWQLANQNSPRPWLGLCQE